MKKAKQQAHNNMLNLSENEIDKQKNQIIDGNDDLFKGFEQPKPKQLQKPPQASSRTQLNSLFNELATSAQQNQSSTNNLEIIAKPAETMPPLELIEQADNQDILEEKGWDEEININIE